MSQADLSERNRPLSVAEQSLHFLDRVHIGPPPGPIRTAAAWRSSDFDGDDAWIQPLGDAEIAAFDAAIAFARLTGKPLDELGPEDFPLPSLSGRIEDWRRELETGRGFLVLRGAPADRWDQPTASLFMRGLGLQFGRLGVQNPQQADKVLNRSVLNEAVVAHWKERASDRRTIFFCSTIAHAEAVAASFMAADVTAAVVSGDMPADHRADVIARFDRGEIQLLVNCMVLTEGFDSQPVGCIGILRPMLHKSTFIQAIGRGLRKVDPERYPGIIKTDCIVLDFAGAALRHGSLEQEISLDNDDPEPGQAPYKCCPSCEAEVPLGASECPICGFGFERRSSAKRVLTDFDLMEIDLLNQSPFKWCDLHGDGTSLMASGFDAWAGVFSDGTLWHALGRPKLKATRVLAIGTRVQALAAADDFLRSTESSQAAAKSRGWINEPASTKQMAKLAEAGIGVSALDFGFSKYDANCRLNFHWNRGAIGRLVNAMQTRMAA